MQTLKQTCFDLWKTNEERKGILAFKPIFIRYIGVENDEYEHILKTIDSQIKRNSEITLFFDGNIPTDSAVSQDVEFSDFLLNHMFSESIEYVLSIATKIDNYSTFEMALLKESLCKWTNQYVKTMDFNTNRNPKCIYYGNIAKEECYFLMLLYRMTFDVVYINPFEDCILKDIDENSLSECNIAEKRIPIDTWQTKIKDSDVISCDESYLYQMQEKIGTQLYGNGIYKPWQFKNYPIAPIEKLYTLMDIENNINEPAKIREGFYVDTVVHIPCFFAKIDGVYQNLIEYNQLLCHCNQNQIIEGSLDDTLSTTDYDLNDFKMIESLKLGKKYKKGLDLKKIKKLPFYKFSQFRTELQNLILDKMNETIQNGFCEDISDVKVERFVMNVLNMDDQIVKLLDNFDYTSYIPKIIVFLENEKTINVDTMMMLGFYHNLGFDILIFDPSGLTNLDIALKTKMITNIRLDYMKYNLSFQDTHQLEIKQKKRFLFFKS